MTPEHRISASYDELADVLYLSTSGERKMRFEDDPNEAGVVWRYSRETGEPVGVTVMDFGEEWSARLADLADRVSHVLHVEPDHALSVLIAVPGAVRLEVERRRDKALLQLLKTAPRPRKP